jgi:hypothetical protein
LFSTIENKDPDDEENDMRNSIDARLLGGEWRRRGGGEEEERRRRGEEEGEKKNPCIPYTYLIKKLYSTNWLLVDLIDGNNVDSTLDFKLALQMGEKRETEIGRVALLRSEEDEL